MERRTRDRTHLEPRLHPFERGARPLSPHEFAVLTSIETALRRDDPQLARWLGRRRAPGTWRIPDVTWTATALLGAVLVVAGLLASVVLTSFTGFVVLIIGIHQWADGRGPLHPGARVRRWWAEVGRSSAFRSRRRTRSRRA